VAGAEQRKARLPMAVSEKGSDSVVAEDERRVRRMSRDLMCRLSYDGVDFEHQHSQLVRDSLFDRQLVQLMEQWLVYVIAFAV